MHSNCKVSLITPMYNEAGQIEANIGSILAAMDSLGVSWEYILVDDGSKDDSLARARRALAGRNNCKIIHYPQNRGRGYALRQGFEAASGEYVIVTESDLSWGSEIIKKLYATLTTTGDDIVVASVYARGGGMENVPGWRMALSGIGNVVMRTMFDSSVTMLSGMTRGYRQHVIRSLYLEENRKEIHLEIILKAQILGMRICEIPAVITWEPPKPGTKKRRGGLSILKFVRMHLQISLMCGAVKALFYICLMLFLIGATSITVGTLNKVFQFWPGMVPNLVTYGLLLEVMVVVIAAVSIVGNQLKFLYGSVVHLQTQNQKILCKLHDKENGSK